VSRTDGRTDRQTDRITISISRVSSSMLTRDKNKAIEQTSIRKGSGIESAILYLGYSWCLSRMRRNSVLEVLSVRRFADIQEEICCKTLKR